MTKLWLADVEFRVSVVVAGENKSEAEFELDLDDVWSEHRHIHAIADLSPINKFEDLPADWWDQIPYGEDEMICEEILKSIEEARLKKEAEEYRDKFQLKLDLDIPPNS